MDGQWAVVVGAGLGASGAVVGALTSWAGTRLHARTQMELAQVQHDAQHDAETTAQKRAACSALILAVDNTRRQMRVVRDHLRERAGVRGTDAQLQEKRAAVHDRIREMQAAEWLLRLMLSDQEQAMVTRLTDALYATHQALIDDVEEWLLSGPPGGGREARDAERYATMTGPLQSQMMSFAGDVYARLYTGRAAESRQARRDRS
ncbi:hypothetical protein [Streptomyces sp. YS-3]|uniref:hypothetical protein n=1 Tax=Streptomyces sp. YS-3 TaxID=3381352 RepID=UPI0038625A40